MEKLISRLREYLIGNYYIIIGSNHDLWQILPLLYENNFIVNYRDNIIVIDLKYSQTASNL